MTFIAISSKDFEGRKKKTGFCALFSGALTLLAGPLGFAGVT